MATLEEQRENINKIHVPREGVSLIEICVYVKYPHTEAYSVLMPLLDLSNVKSVTYKAGLVRVLPTYFLNKIQATEVLNGMKRILNFKIKRKKEKARK
jgi:hypothetical protein